MTEEAQMQVRNIRWVGVSTHHYDPMAAFLSGVLGLTENFRDDTTVEFRTSEGDELQIMAPGDPYHAFFAEHANGPVPLMEVDDVHAAHQELVAAGIEVVGDFGRDSRWEWLHFRAPDGNLYELASRLDEPPAEGPPPPVGSWSDPGVDGETWVRRIRGGGRQR